MAQRTVALCDGKYIGIETIYTVINGEQINIPDKLEELRAKGRNNQLFCPCGCGANLVVVAGDKNLREQHFRIKDKDAFPGCKAIAEGSTSINSKIVLKCWLDENIHADDLESRVPISDVSDSKRRYEFTFLSRTKKVALNYCYDRANLSDEKLSILDKNAVGIKIIHVADAMNAGTEGQYPEWLMKMQNRQGYCLLLSIEDLDYEKAELEAMFSAEDIDGRWQEIFFASGLLKQFSITDEGKIIFEGKDIAGMLADARKQFTDSQEKEKERRIQAEKERQERYKAWLEEQAKQQAERERRQAEAEAKLKKQEEERKAKELKKQEEDQQRREDFKKNMAESFKQQITPVVDPDGVRWIQCEFCGKMDKTGGFVSYGGPNHINLGTCKECARNNPDAQVKLPEESAKRKRNALGYCPRCGRELVERNGRRGRFIGCAGYPRCNFTDSL